MPEAEYQTISPNLAYHIRTAHERRELALELNSDLGAAPAPFPLKATLQDDPEEVGIAIRNFLGVDDDIQKKAARQDRSFDFWRRRLEERDILVFVISGPHYGVELGEMRGFAIAKNLLPVIVVNGKDYSQGGKAFTLLHELTHIMLGESAISNGTADELVSVEDKKIERFCDSVAAAALMPRGLVLSVAEIAPVGARPWSEEQLRTVARSIGVSRHALLLRLVSLKRTSWEFYRSQIARFKEEALIAGQKEKKPIPIKRPVLLMSWNGRGYTRLVLRSYYDRRITLNDVSSYLGAKVKHIPALERAVFQAME